jgi:hypothetical protein
MAATPVIGEFTETKEPNAASKLKMGRPVPETAPTVTLAEVKISANAFDRHASVVADSHDDVKHTPRSPPPPCSSPAVAVCSPTPKLSPDTVTDAYPVCGVLPLAWDARAESKEKMGMLVPDTPATVTVTLPNTSAKGLERQVSVVNDVHDDVRQEPRSPPPPR